MVQNNKMRPNPAAHRQEEAAAELRMRREAEAREREVAAAALRMQREAEAREREAARRLAQDEQREMQVRPRCSFKPSHRVVGS